MRSEREERIVAWLKDFWPPGPVPRSWSGVTVPDAHLDALLAERDTLTAEVAELRTLCADVRESVRGRDGSTCDIPKPLLARLDALLAAAKRVGV